MPEPRQEDEARWVARISAGDRQALGELYDRHAPRLLALARRMLRDRSEAEDLVHDVFVEVWHGASRYERGRGTVRAWLLVRTRSRALDRLRMGAQRRHAPALEREPAAGEPAAPSDRIAVVRALRSLPPEQRRTIELAYFAGLSASEIAAEMGAPLGTVKSRLAGALGRLRQTLRVETAWEERA